MKMKYLLSCLHTQVYTQERQTLAESLVLLWFLHTVETMHVDFFHQIVLKELVKNFGL